MPLIAIVLTAFVVGIVFMAVIGVRNNRRGVRSQPLQPGYLRASHDAGIAAQRMASADAERLHAQAMGANQIGGDALNAHWVHTAGAAPHYEPPRH